MASLEERLAQMKSGGAASPSPIASQPTTQNSGSLTDRLAAMKSSASPAPAVQTPKPEVVTEKKDDDRNLWEKTMDFLGFTTGKAAAGVAEGAEGIVNAVGYYPQLVQKSAMQQAAGGAAMAAAFSKDPLVDEYAKKQQTAAQEDINKEMKTIANFGDKATAKVEEKYADVPLSKATRFVGDVAQGLGGMATTILGNIVVPGLGTAAMVASAFGNSVQEAQKQGAGAGEAAVYGLANSAIEFATEKAFGGMKINGKEIFGTGLLDKAKDALVKKASNGAARASLNTAFSFIGEGLEEFAAEYGQSLANRLTINTEDREWSDVRKDAFRSALIGGTIGGLLNVGSSIEAGKSVTVKEAADIAATEAAKEINETIATQGEISPSDSVSSQPTTDTNAAENTGRDNQGTPGFEAGENVMGDDGLGAANVDFTINEGEQVPTQSKSTVNNKNLNDMQRKAVEPPTHERISEAESLHRAQLGLYTDSKGNIVDYQNSIDDLVDADHELSGVESDRLQLLLDEAGKRNDIDNVKRIAAKLQENTTFAARVLQATQKWIDEGPATRLAAMYQLVDKYAKTHKAKKGKTIEIPDFLAKAYLEADTEAKRDEVVSDIQEYVAQQTRATFGEAFTALRYVNMLGNFKTQGRNFLGNATMLTTTRIKDEVAAVVEGLANAISRGKTGRTKSVFVGRDFVKAAKADYANVKREIMRYGKYSKEDFKGEFVEGIEDSRKLLPPGFEQYRRLTNLAMEGGDAIFSKAAYSRSLAGYLKANGVSAEQLAAGNVDPALMEKARAYAIKQAQETTFRDSNQLSDWVSKAGRSEDTPKLVKAVGEGLMPFRRTPANIMVRAYEYSPLGLINTIVKGVEAAKGNATASDIIEALSKTLTGTGLMALGYWLRDNDLLRGNGDEDDEEIDALMNRQDWSIVIPGKGSYTFDWAAPASLTMFTGAVLNDLYTDEELTLADWFDALASFSEPFVQMSMLNGINDTLDSIKYSDNNLWQLAGQLAASYITQGLTNTLMGQIERSTEDVRMSTYTEADGFLPEWMQRSIGKASAKIPGVDYQQTEYLNEFGETESSGNVGQRILENLFSPGYWEATKEGESAYDFAQRVYDTLGVNAFPDAYPEKEVEYDGEKYPLTQEERNEYQQIRGEAAKEYMELLDGNRDFNTSNKKDKRSIISKALSFANEQAKNNALRDNGVVIEQSKVDKVKEQMSPSEYINWLIADTKAVTPDGYAEGSTPQWQQFEIALSLPDSLAVDMIIAQGGDTGRRISAAVDNGISVERAVEYYRATSERNAEGKSPSKGEVNQRLAAAGFTADERRIMKRAFELTFK